EPRDHPSIRRGRDGVRPGRRLLRAPPGATDARPRHLRRRLSPLLRGVRRGLRDLATLRSRHRRRPYHLGPRGGAGVRHHHAGGRAQAPQTRRRGRENPVIRRRSSANTARPTFCARTGPQSLAGGHPRPGRRPGPRREGRGGGLRV
ncbi:MAG: hypothetical protein AVDCRST_MAG88-218, partial [uncultured Thermomicrobiales bacterium]